MYDPFSHIEEMITHFVSDELRDVINLAGTVAISYLVGRNANKAPKCGTLGLILASLFLLFLIGSAVNSYHRSGFNNGFRFATESVLSLLIAFVIAYPFIRRFLPVRSKRLDWVKDRGRWEIETSPEGKAAIVPSPRGLQFGAQLKDNANRYAKMEWVFDGAQDYCAWAGISFDIRCDGVYPDTVIRLEVKIPNTSNDWKGSTYRVEEPVPVSNGRPIFLFQEMSHPDWAEKNSWGYLNLHQVISVAVVCNTTCDAVEFYVDNFALVKFPNIPS